METQDGTQPSAGPGLSLHIFHVIRTGQSQHGLKHGDYQRYRRYCGRRLSKLRTHVKFHHGRNRFQKKELKPEMVVDCRWLELILLDAERSWAYGNEIKQEIEKAGFVHTNKRRHMLRRFAKARGHAEALAKMSLHACDERTQAEAAAYLDWLTALELFEKDRQMEVAAGHFLRAQRAIQVLATFGSPSVQSACRQKLVEIASIVRLCLHKVAQSHGRDTVAETDVVLPGDEQIDSRIDALTQGASAAPQQSTATFAWHGNRFKIQNEAVAEVLAKVEGLTEAAAGAMDTDEDVAHSAQAVMATYTSMIEALMRAQALLADEVEASTSGAADVADMESLVALQSAVNGALAEAVLHRYTVQGNWMNVKFKRNMASAICKSKHREKGARAEDCIRLFDGLVKAAQELDRVAAMEGVPPAVAEQFVTQSECYRQLYSAARCYYIAHMRLAKSDRESRSVALALFGAVRERLGRAEAAAGGLPGGLPSEQRELCVTLMRESAAYEVVARAELASDAALSDGKLAGSLKNLGLEETSTPAASEYLTDHVHEWKSFAGAQPRIFKLTSLLQTLPMRPITLDTALQFVAEPDVTHRCHQQEAAAPQTSVVAGLKGLFGWGK